MTSVQERLQISRMPLDKWSVREQLCLASAVSCSGDQNWMSVSRTLKIICGNNSSSRPADWFSQKNCAVQYGNLLENVETPKRKKRVSEGSGLALSSIETPTSDDLILRRLTDERIRELKANIRTGQEQYAEVLGELKLLQWGNLSDEQIIEMWREIEKEQEAQRIEEMKLENQMREREQRKLELQRNWRSLATVTEIVKPETSSNAITNTNTIDMEVEEIVTSSKPVLGNMNILPTTQQHLQTAIEPSTTLPPRSVAPTITTLLTSGTIPNTNQPVITLTSFIPPNEAEQLLSRPISGLPTDNTSKSVTNTQTVISPSRSAPTLSMLLEKNKISTCSIKTSELNSDDKVSKEDKSELKVYRSDSINEEVPMDIEEDITQSNMTVIGSNQNNDSDEPDPNEEQQLLEVFKNIGNIDDIDVDIDVSDVIDDETTDFLKDVTEEQATDISSHIDSSVKLAENELCNDEKNAKNQMNETIIEEIISAEEKQTNDKELFPTLTKTKMETSSDDSNDDIPLAAVASLENKDRSVFLETPQETACSKESEEAATKVDDTEEMGNTANCDEFKSPIIEESNNEVPKVAESVEEESLEEKPSQEIECMSGSSNDATSNKSIIEATITEQKENIECKEDIKEVAPKVFEDIKIEKCEDNVLIESKSSEEIHVETTPTENSDGRSTTEDIKATPPPIISISSYGDTDEDSSATDISVSTRRDEKSSITNKGTSSRRKNNQEILREESKGGEDEFATVSATPVRPSLLRKLRERDRSESPMIEEESNIGDHSSTLRGRQRCSSTPVIDSIPNSPASSDRDDRETKASKKSLISTYNALNPNRYGSLFQSIFNDELNTKYFKACLRPMDFQTIKKNIESGNIKSITELQRDVLIMCQNALMICKKNTANYKAVYAYLQDIQNVKNFVSNPHASKIEKESRERKSSGNINVKVRARKSQRNL